MTTKKAVRLTQQPFPRFEDCLSAEDYENEKSAEADCAAERANEQWWEDRGALEAYLDQRRHDFGY